MSSINNESEKLFANFLEKKSLYSKLEFPLLVPIENFNFIPLQLDCNNCNGERTYSYDMEKSDIKFVPGRKSVTSSYQIAQMKTAGIESYNSKVNNHTFKLIYQCQSCLSNNYYFLISFKGNKIYKSGQDPQLGIDIDRRLEQTLGASLVGHYKNGKICENHSLGIAAMAYYRRVVEDKIYDLLDEIAEIFTIDNKEEYLVVIKQVKESHSFETKADLLKDVLPKELNDKNGNLVKFLFSKISEGLHSKSDEECLQISHDISMLLEMIIKIINNKADMSKSIKELTVRLKK